MKLIHTKKGSVVNGTWLPFNAACYVDDLASVEVDIGNRLGKAWSSLLGYSLDVFGADDVNWKKTLRFAPQWTWIGYLWDAPTGTASIPPTKLKELKDKLETFASKDLSTATERRSLVGSLNSTSLRQGRPNSH